MIMDISPYKAFWRSWLFRMELGFSVLFLCYHKLCYRLLIIALAVLDLFCTVYICLYPPPFPEEYNSFKEDRLALLLMHLQIIGGLSNVIISILWFHFNKYTICNVEVDLSLLGVHLISDDSTKKCFKELLTVYLITITAFALNFMSTSSYREHVPLLAVFVINSTFFYGCSGLLSCSLLQLGSFYNDFTRFNKYEDSVLRCQRVYNVFEKICHLFKLPMLLIISWSFLLTMCDLYVIFNPLLPDIFWMKVVLAFYLLYFQYPILMVIRSCNELNKKAKTFNQQLYWEMVEDKSFKLLKNEKLNFHFLVNEEMIFTACGFFTIDNSLIFSMISTATTYLVIVLQYGRNDKPLVPSPTNTSLAILSSEQ
ncbi:Gustatory receptor 95b [Halyomorpha halys]|nr:Gustatory receptor 95b [Halyomorpha halys]